MAKAEETKVTKKTTAKAEAKPVKKTAGTAKKAEVKPKKTEAAKAPAKAVKSEAATAVTEKKAAVTYSSVNVDVIGIDGKAAGKMSLPGEMFGGKVNKVLLAQAIRVYLANQRQGNASTKTRGEVDGSTRKIYRQKGTGRARHGSLRAPIFVKGGIVFGPKPRDYSLSLPKKMKRKALFSALTAKVQDNQLTVVSGLHDIKPKTKSFVEMLKKMAVYDKKQKLLFVMTEEAVSAKRAGQNVTGVDFIAAKQLHPYAVLQTKNLIVTKEAVEAMKEHFLKG